MQLLQRVRETISLGIFFGYVAYLLLRPELRPDPYARRSRLLRFLKL